VLKVTADTNVLVSGLTFGRGKPFQLLKLALEEQISLTTSQEIIDETVSVLTRKFGAKAADVAEATAIIREAARTVRPSVELNVIKEDPPDNRVLECAVSAGSDYIVTGDKDLLRLRQYAGIRIVSVSDFLDMARPRERGGR
jgi:uncharacterized protein